VRREVENGVPVRAGSREALVTALPFGDEALGG